MTETSAPSGASPRHERARLLQAIAVIAIAGAVVASVSLYHHYSSAKTSFCDFGQSFNCDIVNRSAYSTVLGVPVALIGLGGYLLIVILATVYRANRETRTLLLAASIAGLVFSLYLTYVEKFVLHAWCVLCLSSLLLILIEAILSAFLVFSRP